jgi:sarcosine oxidase delta subunit
MPSPVSITKIRATEELFGAPFPAMFKARMAEDNGGVVHLAGESWFVIPFFDDTDRSTLRKTTSSIHRVTQHLRGSNVGFPEDAAAIAENQAGDYLFLRLNSGQFGKEVWLFQLRGGLVSLVRDDVDDLWSDTPEVDE